MNFTFDRAKEFVHSFDTYIPLETTLFLCTQTDHIRN